MRGHHQIIAARMAGFRPTSVSFELHEVEHGSGLEKFRAESDHKSVFVEAKDRPDLTDLRFVVGLSCYVVGEIDAQVKAWGLACKKAGASHVTATTVEVKPWGAVIKNKDATCTS